MDMASGSVNGREEKIGGDAVVFGLLAHGGNGVFQLADIRKILLNQPLQIRQHLFVAGIMGGQPLLDKQLIGLGRAGKQLVKPLGMALQLLQHQLLGFLHRPGGPVAD